MLIFPTARTIRDWLAEMQATIQHEAGPESGSSSQAASAPAKLTLLTLPQELQKEIVKHVRQNHMMNDKEPGSRGQQVSVKSLKSLQLVSKHFHELASAELYADLEFFFSHPDSPSFYMSLHYRPSFALNLFATCSHNYMQYVRTFGFAMSEQDAEDVQKRVASKYHFQEEACKLLNTVLVLVLRKTSVLEKFMYGSPLSSEYHADLPQLECPYRS